jgi:hypothetical protein
LAARPEIAAHHYSEAAIADKAVPYWLLAGKSFPRDLQGCNLLTTCWSNMPPGYYIGGMNTIDITSPTG